MIQATVAILPLGQPVDAAVDAAIERLRARGVVVEVRAMQTEIAGEEDAVFDALRDAFRAASVSGGVVMNVSVSNACPVPVGDDRAEAGGGVTAGAIRPSHARRTTS